MMYTYKHTHTHTHTHTQVRETMASKRRYAANNNPQLPVRITKRKKKDKAGITTATVAVACDKRKENKSRCG